MFEVIRHECLLKLSLSINNADILKQSKSSDDEKNIIKNLASKLLQRQRILKECNAVSISELYFLLEKND